MSLTNVYVQSLSKFSAFFEQIRAAQAPDLFTQQLLKDWGFSSSNDRAFIPLLKALGFLTQDGRPTDRYLQFRDHSQSGIVLAEGIRDAYGDIFLIKEKPTESDREAIKGKFKSAHNTSDNVAGLMTGTFLKLMELADFETERPTETEEPKTKPVTDAPSASTDYKPEKLGRIPVDGLHYNIQIHLPPTKDIEIYNAIFKSMKEHLFES